MIPAAANGWRRPDVFSRRQSRREAYLNIGTLAAGALQPL
jgi:hypothetical protein